MKKYSVPQVEEVEVKALFDINDKSGGGTEAPARQRVSNRFTD